MNLWGTRVRRIVPKKVRDIVARRLLEPIFADEDSAARFWQLRAGELTEPTTVRVKPIGGAPVTLRPSTEDAAVFIDTFYRRSHEPPASAYPITRIVDLGANIGLTAAHLAHSNPLAHITAVEMDSENASLCRLNTEPWRTRCDVQEVAVWPERATLRYEPHRSLTSRHRVGETGSVTVEAIGLDEVIGETDSIDYVKVDIEGAEAGLLKRQTSWASRVRTIRVEVHDDYDSHQCMTDLRALGFSAARDRRHRNHVIGTRS